MDRGSFIRMDFETGRSFLEIPGDDSQLPVDIEYDPDFDNAIHIRTGRSSEYKCRFT